MTNFSIKDSEHVLRLTNFMTSEVYIIVYLKSRNKLLMQQEFSSFFLNKINQIRTICFVFLNKFSNVSEQTPIKLNLSIQYKDLCQPTYNIKKRRIGI